MVGFWFYKYEAEDRDIGVVDYELLDKADVELPVLSLCFQQPLLKDTLKDTDPNVTTRTYLKYLKGKLFDQRLQNIDYFNVTLDLNKYFLYAMIKLSSESHYHGSEKMTTIKHKTIFNGLYKGDFIKCFTAEMQERDIPSTIKEITYYYNQTHLRKDLGPLFTIDFNLHHPGQFLLQINTEWKQIPYDRKGFSRMWFIKGIEYLRRRNTRNRHCMTSWKYFDDMVWKEHIRRNGCRAPYDKPYESFRKCVTKEDVQKSIFDFHVVGSKYYPKACQRISKLDDITESGRLMIGYLDIKLAYPTDVKIITQSKEIDGHALIGNIGGYIGLFLGSNLLRSTILIFSFVKK